MVADAESISAIFVTVSFSGISSSKTASGTSMMLEYLSALNNVDEMILPTISTATGIAAAIAIHLTPPREKYFFADLLVITVAPPTRESSI